MTVLEDILAKGEVEEELLVELSDEQKVVLFYKIRQEQIKRWDKTYNDVPDETERERKTNFLQGADGNEWVWVMGDAPGDESYDQIWVKYALRYAEMEVAKQQQQIPNQVSAAPSVDSVVELSSDSEAKIGETQLKHPAEIEKPDACAELSTEEIKEEIPDAVIPEAKPAVVEKEASESLTGTRESKNELSQNEELTGEEFSFVDDEDEKFPVDSSTIQSADGHHSDSSDDNMPFPVGQQQLQPRTTPNVSLSQKTVEEYPRSENVLAENLGSVQDRLKLFGAVVSRNPMPERKDPQIHNIPIYRPTLPNNGSQGSLTGDQKFPVLTETRATTIEPNKYNVQSPNPNQINFQANFGRFANPYPYSASNVQPPVFRPTYTESSVRPNYQQPTRKTSNEFWPTSATPQTGIFTGQGSLSSLTGRTPSPSQNGSSVDFSIASSTVSSNFSSVSRNGVSNIKTNPLAKPPQQVPKPIIPPRNMTSFSVNNQTFTMSNSGLDGSSPLPSINLEASVSQLIAKQNVMVQRFLRQSIIRDEEQANILQADWEESERKAKEEDEKLKQANERFREIARRVIQEQLPVPLSRAFLLSSDKSDGANGPHDKVEVIQWFQREELDARAGCDPETGAICIWFHGIINRTRAEDLLRHASVGSFLIRVSEKIFGYTLSYRAQDRCKHFLIDKHDNTYQFFGLNMKRHGCLFDLVMYHRSKPVSASGNELLLYPVGQVNGQPLDYAELFQRNLSLSSSNHGSSQSFGSLNKSSENSFSYPSRNIPLATRF